MFSNLCKLDKVKKTKELRASIDNLQKRKEKLRKEVNKVEKKVEKKKPATIVRRSYEDIIEDTITDTYTLLQRNMLKEAKHNYNEVRILFYKHKSKIVNKDSIKNKIRMLYDDINIAALR